MIDRIPMRVICCVTLIASSLSLNGAAQASEKQAPQQQQPNVVIFLSDDQGWADLSVHGNVN